MFSAFKKFGRMGSGSSIPWTPTKLFAAGEKGGLWDFTTLANLYQDSAGTTPCTAVGDPIGKVLDTSGRGNHLTQSTSTKRPTLGRMPATGVRNLLTHTEDFSNATWGKTGCTVTANRILATATTGWHYIRQAASITGGPTISIEVKRDNNDWIIIGPSDTRVAYFNTATGLFGSLGLGVLATSVTATSDGYWRLSITTSSYAVDTFLPVGLAAGDGVGNFTAVGTEAVFVRSPQFELGSTATAYQKVGAAYDVTESGVASVYTAYFDGVDDCLVSPSIDFTATDKMSVFSGFRKTSDAARGMVAELSATTASNNGSFALTAPNAASATIVYESKGTSLTDTSATVAAPADSVISAVSDISADSNILRRNGVQTDSDTGDQGTGNFGNYPLYAGQRAATSLPYKGFLSAVCARGAATDASTITNMEQWLAARTPGVTLP